MMQHVICAHRERGSEWSRLQEKWQDVTDIYTIGFESRVVYLAPALEAFLIRAFPNAQNARV
jgi:hypothetical protein